MKQYDNKPALSVIVPIYNVENYLSQCLDSIGRQTCGDFEVLMIDDGSTDGCGEICREWERRDGRFRYFYQSNQGLGPARNKGIREARAERILFIDSDDWVDETIVEKLLSKSISTDADAVYCDFCAVYPDGEKRIIPIRSLFQLINATGEERIHYSVQRSLWAVVYKKSIWTDNDLFMPDIIYEDTAIYGVLLCYLKKMETVSEALYFYRANRAGSLMQEGRKDYRNMLRALNVFLEGAKPRSLYAEYAEHFFRYCSRQLSIEWRKIKKSLSENELVNVKRDLENVLSEHFAGWREKPVAGFLALGSFISCEVYNKMTLFGDTQKENYSFTSLESLMSGKLEGECYQLSGTNLYRVEMVEKDLKKIWRKRLPACKYVILDLLEERHDLIQCGDTYITNSEAFHEVCTFRGKCRIIPRKSQECREIWMRSCDGFFDQMQREKKQVFVLELYLCEMKGLRGKETYFEDIEEIGEINEELKYYYNYIRSTVPDAVMVPMREEAFFSATDYTYGCFPWHYNEMGIFVLEEQIYNELYNKGQ